MRSLLCCLFFEQRELQTDVALGQLFCTTARDVCSFARLCSKASRSPGSTCPAAAWQDGQRVGAVPGEAQAPAHGAKRDAWRVAAISAQLPRRAGGNPRELLARGAEGSRRRQTTVRWCCWCSFCCRRPPPPQPLWLKLEQCRLSGQKEDRTPHSDEEGHGQ